MYVPAVSLSVASGSNGSHTDIGSWSSLIGIITAICGNILISFALNTQRYAHMRLGKDRENARVKAKEERGQRRNPGDATHEANADGQPRKNAKASTGDIDIESADAERQPLIPKLGSRKSSSSTSDTYVDEKEDGNPSKSYLRSPIWWLGISMMVVGEAGNFLAYGFAPASIVSPLGVVALVSNCLIAPLLLHEEFRLRDGLGVIIAIGGCVTVVLSASGSNPKLDPDDIWKLITQWEFETYLGITVALIVALMIASNRVGHKSVLIDLGLVALFGGYTALSTKGVASLLSNKIWKVFTFPITYLLIAILVSTAVLQIKYVNRALQRFNSTIVIPTQFVLFTISVIVGSAVLYRDFEKRSAADAGKFFGGCALTFLGVWCITSGRTDGDNEGDDDEDNDEADEELGKTQDDTFSPKTPPRLQRPLTGDLTPQLQVTSPKSDGAAAKLGRILQAGGVPANRSAIHGDLTAEPSSSKPAMHATTSEPVVPTVQASSPVLHPPAGEGPRGSPSLVPPTTPGQHMPHRLLSRHSIVDLLPGPFMSPLSSSLSAIVADSLRRGVDAPASSLRARTLRLHRSKTGDDPSAPPNKRHSIDSADLDLNREAAPQADPRQTRLRSLSTTISDIFTSPLKRHRSQDQSGSGH